MSIAFIVLFIIAFLVLLFFDWGLFTAAIAAFILASCVVDKAVEIGSPPVEQVARTAEAITSESMTSTGSFVQTDPDHPMVIIPPATEIREIPEDHQSFTYAYRASKRVMGEEQVIWLQCLEGIVVQSGVDLPTAEAIGLNEYDLSDIAVGSSCINATELLTYSYAMDVQKYKNMPTNYVGN